MSGVRIAWELLGLEVVLHCGPEDAVFGAGSWQTFLDTAKLGPYLAEIR